MGLDLGSTSVKSVAYDRRGVPLVSVSRRINTRVDGTKVTQNPREIVTAVEECLSSAVEGVLSRGYFPESLGIASQRSSFLLFTEGGAPLTDLISWRDSSALSIVERISSHGKRIRELTGLPLTPYYSAPKLSHVIGGVKSEVMFGTLSTYVLYSLTGGKTFSVDPANAQRTLLFDLRKREFSGELMELFSIPENVLFPEIKETVSDFGRIRVAGVEVPVTSVNGDQQAAAVLVDMLFPGATCVNLGTGGFWLTPVDDMPSDMDEMIVSLGFVGGELVRFFLEGTINGLGENVKIISEITGISVSELRTASISEVPLFSGAPLGTGAPLWDLPFPIVIEGIKRGTTSEDLLYAAIFGSTCFLRIMRDVVERITNQSVKLCVLSGGYSRVQGVPGWIRDLIQVEVRIPDDPDLTVMSAALTAPLAHGEIDSGALAARFREVTEVSPVEAVNYFSAWQNLYERARAGS